MTISSNLLEIKDLTIEYETYDETVTAVSDLSMSIKSGQSIGLVGESGSGKSTVAAALLDLMAPEGRIKSGSIFFEGADLGAMPKKMRRSLLGTRISIVFQDPFTSLNPSMRIGLQIAEPLVQHRGYSHKQALKRARELLAEMGIQRNYDVANAYAHQLSGGMQQRSLIATALSCEPSLIVLDEPTTALDVTIEAQILDLLNELKERLQLSLLYITHNLAVVKRLCDVTYVIYAGHLVEIGPTDDLFRRPIHPYTKGLFACLPQISGQRLKTRLAPIPGSLPNLTDLPTGCIFHSRCKFAENRCKEERQTLKAIDNNRFVRCWKARDVADLPWPVSDLQPSSKILIEHGEPLVKVNEMSKRFRIGGLWNSLELRNPGQGLFPIVHKPRYLTAVNRVSFAVTSGEVLGLVGESGCGKTTLGRCLLRLLDVSSGEIIFDGEEIARKRKVDLRSLRPKAQIIFQNPDSSLNPRKTIGDIIGRPLELFKTVEPARIKHRVAELLELVNLPSVTYAKRYPHQLSGGEKQRVGIARALAPNPKFILCDEALSALDVSVQAGIINLLSDLRSELGLAMIFISHDLSVVAHLADRVAVMYHGRFCEIGSTMDVLHPPYHPYTHALLSSIPQFEVASEKVQNVRLPEALKEQTSNGNCCIFHTRCPIKIGALCDVRVPPVLQLDNDHEIHCHHSLERLNQLESVIPRVKVSTQ